MSVKNSSILSRAWLEGTNSFQQRIPNPSCNSYATVIEHLFAPMNNDLFNEFSGMLNGLIGTHIETKQFINPYKFIKKPSAIFGASERSVAVKYLQAHAGRFDDQTLLKVEKPEYVEWFYSVTEPRRYEFSWSRPEMAQAFSQDGYGFEDLLSATISQMLTSAEVDEMNIMLQMFAEADTRLDGLYRHHLNNAPDDETSAKELLKGIRAVAGRMKFPSMLYNHIPVPVFENPNNLIVWTTPEVLASLDVDALASVFQLDKAEIKYRIVEVPEFPIPNVYAAITSEDFIYYRDVMTGLEPPFYNPGNRTMKYYYWANAIIGINPAANCVLFTTDEQTVIPTTTMTVNSFGFTSASYNVELDGSVKLDIVMRGDVANDPSGKIAVEPQSAMFDVLMATDEDGNAVKLNSRTYVDDYGVLHLQKTGITVGTTIKVGCKATYINPSGATQTLEDECSVIVVAKTPQGAKECSVAKKPFIEYTNESDPATASE